MARLSKADPVTNAVKAALDRQGPGLFGVACSGGADSIALAHAAIEIAGARHVVVVSIDHGLSPGSDAVTAAVASWARGLGAAGIVRRVVVARRASLEAAAREARYAALDALADELGATAVLLGHTARDQAETVLMRIVRGTGPAGLAGIPAQRGRFVRPLLRLPRQAIDDHVARHRLPVWEDPMNDDLAITRVRIRREVMPVLHRENPRLDVALGRLATSAAEWLEVIDRHAGPLARFPFECQALAAHPAAVRKRAIALALEHEGIDYDAVHLDEIDRVVTGESRGQVAVDVPGRRLLKTYGVLAFASPSSARPELQLPTGPYTLRPWRPGDRMKPARLRGRSRKLSDLFIDAKVPRDRRTAARVLVRTTDDVIVWAEHLGLAFEQGPHLVPRPPQTGESF